jgi:hypothetical protein
MKRGGSVARRPQWHSGRERGCGGVVTTMIRAAFAAQCVMAAVLMRSLIGPNDAAVWEINLTRLKHRKKSVITRLGKRTRAASLKDYSRSCGYGLPNRSALTNSIE